MKPLRRNSMRGDLPLTHDDYDILKTDAVFRDTAQNIVLVEPPEALASCFRDYAPIPRVLRV